jgi:hypothetical protein
MAIIKVSQFNSAPTAVSDYEAQNAHIMAFINQVNSQAFILTNPTGTTEPTIKQDTYINHGGTLYTVDTADETITGSPADGNVYIKLSVSGDNLIASYVTDISSYTWNQVYGYLASGTDIILPYMLVKSGTSWTKYRMDIRNPAKIVTTTVNTGQGDNELYPMNQGVRTTDEVTFSVVNSGKVNTGHGDNELYPMNQGVRTSDDVTFNQITLSGNLLPRTFLSVSWGPFSSQQSITLDRGLYHIYPNNEVRVEVYINGTWREAFKNDTSIAGFVLSDGTNARIKNYTGITTGTIYGIRV